MNVKIATTDVFSNNINIKTILKMIDRFLYYKRININQLADLANVESRSITKLYHCKHCDQKTIKQVAIAIIKLYCKTRWSS